MQGRDTVIGSLQMVDFSDRSPSGRLKSVHVQGSAATAPGSGGQVSGAIQPPDANGTGRHREPTIF